MENKIYTEEDVRKAIKLAQQCEHECGGVYFDYTENEVIEELTPIEIPSDDEIIGGYFDLLEFKSNLFISGAKWMRDKIGGKK
jgi:hypothetical protein